MRLEKLKGHLCRAESFRACFIVYTLSGMSDMAVISFPLYNAKAMRLKDNSVTVICFKLADRDSLSESSLNAFEIISFSVTV